MITKTFHASTMSEALEDIQEELGPESLVISVRQVTDGPSWQVWRPQGVEVVAMSPIPQPKPEKIANLSNRKLQPRDEKDIGVLLQEITTKLERSNGNTKTSKSPAAIQKEKTPQIVDTQPSDQLSESLTDEKKSQTKKTSKCLEKYKSRLNTQRLDKSLILKVTDTCSTSLSLGALTTESRVTEHLSTQLKAFISALTGKRLGFARVLFFVGLSGSGKTNTIAKIAKKLSRDQNQKVIWICADTIRAGAIAEARVYADSLGIPLRLAYTADDLSKIMEEGTDADLILIDTPGCNPTKESSIAELGAFLTAVPQRTIYLVCSATSKVADMSQLFISLQPFNLQGLVITKMDETSTFGDVFNLAWKSRLPIAYMSYGPGVLDRLLDAQTSDLVNELLGI